MWHVVAEAASSALLHHVLHVLFVFSGVQPAAGVRSSTSLLVCTQCNRGNTACSSIGAPLASTTCKPFRVPATPRQLQACLSKQCEPRDMQYVSAIMSVVGWLPSWHDVSHGNPYAYRGPKLKPWAQLCWI